MPAVESIRAEARDRAGKGAARATRRDGRVPAVIYGDKKEPTLISLDPKELDRLVHKKAFFATLLDVEIGGNKHRVLPRDVQFDPVTDKPLHVDFLRVNKDTKIHVNVPVVVKQRGAVAGHQARRRAEPRAPRDRVPVLAGQHPAADRGRHHRPRHRRLHPHQQRRSCRRVRPRPAASATSPSSPSARRPASRPSRKRRRRLPLRRRRLRLLRLRLLARLRARRALLRLLALRRLPALRRARPAARLRRRRRRRRPAKK